MSLVSKLYVEDKEITILDFKFRFIRSTDEHGKPMGKPRGTIFEIIFETTADQSFMEWSIATDMTKHVKIVVSPVTETSKSRVIELYDVHCVYFKNNFNAQDGEPMTTLIHLTSAIMIDDGYKVLDHYWKKTDLSTDSPVTTIEPEKNVEEIEALVTGVTGSEKIVYNQKYTYKVTSYNKNVTEVERKSVNWIIKIDNKLIELEQKGEVLEYKVKDENYIGKTITFMPYLVAYTEDVSVCSDVETIIIKSDATSGLSFKDKEANVIFTPSTGVNASNYLIRIFAKNKIDEGDKVEVYLFEKLILESGENWFTFKPDYIFYNEAAKKVAISGKYLPNIIEFSFEIEINEQLHEVKQTLPIYFIRYTPEIEKMKGWTNGSKLLSTWFTFGSNDNKDNVDPMLNMFTWDWVMSESTSAKNDFTSFFEDTKEELDAYFSNKVKNGLRSEVKKMISNGLVSLPTDSNKITSFGVLDKTFTTKKSKKKPNGEIMPQFEIYYFNYESFTGTDILSHYARKDWEMDDIIASLANFNFRVSASGRLIHEDNEIKINVDKLHFYIKDQFDFEDEEEEENSQDLGFWKISDKNEFDVKSKLFLSDKEDYFRVQNSDFRKYRDDNCMGYDYYVYSTIHTENVNIELDYE